MSKHALFTLAVSLFCTCVAIGQTPQSINFQGVARDNGGQILPNQSIGVRISILDGSQNGTMQMVEVHATSTNQLGLFNLQIGSGTPVLGALALVDWRTGGTKWLRIEMDSSGGTNYQLMGTQQLISVPYALFANDAASLQGNPVSNTAPQLNQSLIWNGLTWVPTTNLSNSNTNSALSLIYTTQGF